MKNSTKYTINTVKGCNDYFDIETSNPLVSVIDLSKIKISKCECQCLDFYAVICCITDDDSDSAGYIQFVSPSHASCCDKAISQMKRGWMLVFHPDLLEDTLLTRRMAEYSFFESPTSKVVQLSERERDTIVNCMLSIRDELSNEMDRYSKRILVSGIAVLLSVSMRYAERQATANTTSNKNVVVRLNTLLNYYASLPGEGKTLPTVAECARELNISANYLGDLMRNQAGCTAKEYIQQFIVNEAKIQLSRRTLTVNQIAYNLGFKYPHHLTRLFKRMTGITPNEYRAMAKR